MTDTVAFSGNYDYLLKMKKNKKNNENFIAHKRLLNLFIFSNSLYSLLINLNSVSH